MFMFRLIVALFSLMLGSLFRPDDSPAGDDPPKDPPAGDDPPEDSPEDEIVVRFKDEESRQAWLDKQFSERYKRKQEEIREQEREALEKEMREKNLEEQEKWKELAGERLAKITELQGRITELEGQVGDSEALQGRISALEDRLKGMLRPQLERVPELFREFVEAKSPEEQAKWFEENAEHLEGSDGPIGSPPTPSPRDRDPKRERQQDDKEAAEATHNRVVSRL